MDIPGFSMLQSQHMAQLDVSTALMKKVKDAAMDNGDWMNQMLDDAAAAQRVAEPFKGANIDFRS